MVSIRAMTSASSPVSSFTSRNAACSEVSPADTAPFGNPQRVRPRVAIMATYGTPSRRSITAPPEECSFRVLRRASGIPQIRLPHHDQGHGDEGGGKKNQHDLRKRRYG